MIMTLYLYKHLLQATCAPQVRVEICYNATLATLLTYSELVVKFLPKSLCYSQDYCKLMAYYNG